MEMLVLVAECVRNGVHALTTAIKQLRGAIIEKRDMGNDVFQLPRRAIRRHLIPVFLREILDKHVNLRLLSKQVTHRIKEFSHVVPLSFDSVAHRAMKSRHHTEA